MYYFALVFFFALSVLALAQSAHSVALHAGILLSHDSPHPLMHSVVWGIHRFPGWLFLELICVCVCAHVCVSHLYEHVINTVYMLYIIWNKFI